MSAIMGLPSWVAAAATGVACILFGLSVIAIQLGLVWNGSARSNPAATVVRVALGVAMATLGVEIIILVLR